MNLFLTHFIPRNIYPSRPVNSSLLGNLFLLPNVDQHHGVFSYTLLQFFTVYIFIVPEDVTYALVHLHFDSDQSKYFLNIQNTRVRLWFIMDSHYIILRVVQK